LAQHGVEREIVLAPIFFHPARTQPVDPLLNRRVPPSPEKEKTGRDRRRMNKKEARELSSAGFFSFRTPSKSFFRNAGLGLEDYLLHFFLFSVSHSGMITARNNSWTVAPRCEASFAIVR